MNSYDVFIAVVELKNISAAAKKLHRSPSAISKQISALESRLNVQLIDRSTRSLSVTEAGRQYYQRCVDISKQMADAESELLDISNQPSGTLKLTCPVPVSYSEIAHYLSEFSAAYPEIHLDIDVNINLKNLIDDDLDFAIRVGQLEDSSLVAMHLANFKLVICAAPSAIERWGKPENVSDFEAFPMLMQSNMNNAQKAKEVISMFPKFVFSGGHKVNDIVTMMQLAKQGMGAIIIFEQMVEKELSEGSLIQLLPDVTIAEIPVHLVFQRLDYMPKKQRCFIDFFKARCL